MFLKTLIKHFKNVHKTWKHKNPIAVRIVTVCS